MLAQIAGVVTVALVLWGSHRYEFNIKMSYRSYTLCRKSGHKYIKIYGRTQQCRVCHRVSDISWEVTKK